MKTILVIEDNSVLLDNICELIELIGYKVIKATEGQTGLMVLNNNSIDLILCDIKMGPLSGFEVLQQLIESKHKNVPFVFMSAVSEPKELKKAFEQGADGFLVKPFDDTELQKTILSYIEAPFCNSFRKRNHSLLPNSEKIISKTIS